MDKKNNQRRKELIEDYVNELKELVKNYKAKGFSYEEQKDVFYFGEFKGVSKIYELDYIKDLKKICKKYQEKGISKQMQERLLYGDNKILQYSKL